MRYKVVLALITILIGSCSRCAYLIKGDKVIATVGLKPEIEERPPEPFLLRPKVKQ